MGLKAAHETEYLNERHRQNFAQMFERDAAELRPAPVPADDAGDAPDLEARLAGIEQSIRDLAQSDAREAVMDADEQRRLALLEAAIKDGATGDDLLSRLKSRRFWVTVLGGGGLVVGALQQAFAGDPRWAGVLGTLATVIGSVYIYAQSGEDKAKVVAASAIQQTKIAALAAPGTSLDAVKVLLQRRN